MRMIFRVEIKADDGDRADHRDDAWQKVLGARATSDESLKSCAPFAQL